MMIWSGWVYWSNWTSLMEVARSIQSQRGLGAAKSLLLLLVVLLIL